MKREVMGPKLRPWIRQGVAWVIVSASLVSVALAMGVLVASLNHPEPGPLYTRCPSKSLPYMVHDGEHCRVNWDAFDRPCTPTDLTCGGLLSNSISADTLGPLNVTGNVTMESVDTVNLNAISTFEPTIHRIDYDDTITITDGRHTALFSGPFPGAKIHAPNTFRDGSKCYSLNVLHVDGTRVPVECE